MNRSLILALVAFMALLIPASTNARFVEIWSYADLTKQSDLVIIGRLHDSRDDGQPATFANTPVIAVDSTISVVAILKGNSTGRNVTVHLFRRHGPEPTVGINGVPFFIFKTEPVYILFLRKREDGRYEPVSGQAQPASSFIVVGDDDANAVKKLKWESR